MAPVRTSRLVGALVCTDLYVEGAHCGREGNRMAETTVDV